MWGNYNMIFSVRRGAQIIQYPLFNENGGFNLKGFESCLLNQSKDRNKLIVILNFPNNPTGYTPYPAEAEKIAETLLGLAEKGTNIVVLSDDAYFGLFYDDLVIQESIFAKLANKHPRLLAVKLDAATKEYYVWGLRVGFITYSACLKGVVAPVYDALERKTAGDVRGSISNASHLGQSIILKSLQTKELAKEKEEKYQVMKKRALAVKRVLEDKKYEQAWEVYPFNSGYFMCIKLKTVEAEKLRNHLLDQYGIGVIALGQADIRIAFSCLEEENIQETFDTILSAVNDLED
jgi:aspartate/methionine/tyrosine aminotransferase